MAIISKNVVIGTSATLIHTSASNGCTVHIYSTGSGQDVTLGPSTVVSGTGYQLPASKVTEFDFNLPPGESLYGIVASSTKTLNVLVVEY